jgi:hypothetical protein
VRGCGWDWRQSSLEQANPLDAVQLNPFRLTWRAFNPKLLDQLDGAGTRSSIPIALSSRRRHLSVEEEEERSGNPEANVMNDQQLTWKSEKRTISSFGRRARECRVGGLGWCEEVEITTGLSGCLVVLIYSMSSPFASVTRHTLTHVDIEPARADSFIYHLSL